MSVTCRRGEQGNLRSDVRNVLGVQDFVYLLGVQGFVYELMRGDLRRDVFGRRLWNSAEAQYSAFNMLTTCSAAMHLLS